jgi:hypothetical protein
MLFVDGTWTARLYIFARLDSDALLSIMFFASSNTSAAWSRSAAALNTSAAGSLSAKSSKFAIPALSVLLPFLRGISMYAMRYFRIPSARFHPNNGRMI